MKTTTQTQIEKEPEGNEFLPLLEKRNLRNFEKGQSLFRKGDAADKVYYIQKGIIKTIATDLADTACVTGLQKRGDIVGLHQIIHENDVFSTSAICLTHIQAYYIDKQVLLNYLRGNNEMYMHLIKNLCNELELLETRVSNLTGKNANQRMADECLYLGQLFSASGNNQIEIPIDVHELSELVNASQITTQKLIRDFADQKIITYANGVLRIIDQNKLYHIANLTS